MKAILQYTAQVYPEYDPLTEGAGFLNAWGAVELARYLAAPAAAPSPSTEGWSKALIWGNHRIQGGRFLATGNAWLTSVEWGKATTPTGERVAWGEICTADCAASPVWEPWQTSCGDPTCTTTRWGNGTSSNVVWGPACGGANCSSATVWNPEGAQAATVVWGSTSGDTVVWGSTGDDTVVWGSTGDDTVVWGSTGCADSSCESVVWEN